MRRRKASLGGGDGLNLRRAVGGVGIGIHDAGVRGGVRANGGRPHEAAGAMGAGVGAVACVNAGVGGEVVFAGEGL